ncbi:MAG TPA: selenide, water dikinase SelD, partial [Usitatibacter sp.]|nr:selenide, water dikinase SelD [Usitatibacter sp.]
MDMQVRLTQFSHGGGCGCKIAPGVLEQILARGAPGILPKELLVGIETSDDAAVYRINERQAIVATTDFFMPIVDDPFDFGAIAATNAISDVYAMGGQPLFALALVGMPVNQLPLDTIRKILEGGESVCARAGIPVAGGHTIDSVEPIYGLVAIGLVDPRNVKRNSGARPGDKLVLGKPLGVGILS